MLSGVQHSFTLSQLYDGCCTDEQDPPNHSLLKVGEFRDTKG